MNQPPKTRGAGRSRRTLQGERRTVTVLFCDVAGSTAMAEQLDPEEWAEIMNDAFQYLTGPIERYEGTVARLMGDAILAFFGAPVAHEDDPQRAVLAGLDIVDGVGTFRQEIAREYGLDFNVRVGINTGPVVVGEVGSEFAGEYTAMGDAVNLASRMEQSAEPGTVQVAESTYALIEPLFDFEPLRPIEVKGKTEPVPAFRVKGLKAELGRVRGIEGLSAPLVGRDEEMDTLRRIASELREGRGQIVCMIGEPGLGKSRLGDHTSYNSCHNIGNFSGKLRRPAKTNRELPIPHGTIVFRVPDYTVNSDLVRSEFPGPLRAHQTQYVTICYQ